MKRRQGPLVTATEMLEEFGKTLKAGAVIQRIGPAPVLATKRSRGKTRTPMVHHALRIRTAGVSIAI